MQVRWLMNDHYLPQVLYLTEIKTYIFHKNQLIKLGDVIIIFTLLLNRIVDLGMRMIHPYELYRA